LRLLALLFTGVAGIGFLLAFSRGGAVALAIVVAIMALLRLITRRQLLMIGVAAALGLVALPQYWTRLTTIRDVPGVFSSGAVKTQELDSAIKSRLTEMLAAAMVFADHPVIGVGPGMFKHYSQEYGNRLGIRKLTETRKAHSLYLEAAAEGGALGLLCFLAMVLVTMYGLIIARRRLLRGPPEAAPGAERERLELANTVTGFFLALIAYLASGLFLHLAYIRFFYLMLALAGAASWVALSRIGSPSKPLAPAPPSDLYAQSAREGHEHPGRL
jgi:O-antigen ligase